MSAPLDSIVEQLKGLLGCSRRFRLQRIGSHRLPELTKHVSIGSMVRWVHHRELLREAQSDNQALTSVDRPFTGLHRHGISFLCKIVPLVPEPTRQLWPTQLAPAIHRTCRPTALIFNVVCRAIIQSRFKGAQPHNISACRS